jgi:hypothetical protein
MTGNPRKELLGHALERGRAALDGLVDADPRLATIDFETELIAGRPERGKSER